MALQLSEEHYWQLLELVASPDIDLDTDSIAECLFLIANGDSSQQKESTQQLVSMIREYLPDFAN